jgi:hypothetical protein
MKTLITLLLACCFGSAMAQSILPACLGTDVTRWTACFGTERIAGHTYIGEFKGGKPNGQGTYTYANGSKYVGEYKDGKRNGQGTYTYADGSWHSPKLVDKFGTKTEMANCKCGEQNALAPTTA